MYHDMIDEIEDQLAGIVRESVESVSLSDGWVCLDMKDGTKKKLFQSMESMFDGEFKEVAAMVLGCLQSKPAQQEDKNLFASDQSFSEVIVKILGELFCNQKSKAHVDVNLSELLPRLAEGFAGIGMKVTFEVVKIEG